MIKFHWRMLLHFPGSCIVLFFICLFFCNHKCCILWKSLFMAMIQFLLPQSYWKIAFNSNSSFIFLQFSSFRTILFYSSQCFNFLFSRVIHICLQSENIDLAVPLSTVNLSQLLSNSYKYYWTNYSHFIRVPFQKFLLHNSSPHFLSYEI